MSGSREKAQSRVDELAAQAESLLQEGRTIDAATTSLEGMDLTAHSNAQRWAMFALNLTGVIPDVLGQPDLVRRSIDALELLVNSGVLPSRNETIGRAHLALARLYTVRGFDGDADRAAEHYHRAMEAFDREDHPEEWAAAKVGVGIALMSKIKNYRGSDLRAGSTVLEEAKNNLQAAVRAYEEAFSVYTEETFPDDWAATKKLISACERMAEGLARRG